MEIMHSSSWRRIEVVITGRTRNAFALRGTRVRIPPSPFEKWSRESECSWLSVYFIFFFFLSLADKRKKKTHQNILMCFFLPLVCQRQKKEKDKINRESTAFWLSASFFKRRRRDSNPRAPEGKRISSAPRYDHFDTSPWRAVHDFHTQLLHYNRIISKKKEDISNLINL